MTDDELRAKMTPLELATVTPGDLRIVIACKRYLLLKKWRESVRDICEYDRRVDEELTRYDVKRLLNDGHVSLKEILAAVTREFYEHFPDMRKE